MRRRRLASFAFIAITAGGASLLWAADQGHVVHGLPTVWVLPADPGGAPEYKAQLLALSADSVMLLVDGQRRDMPLTKVARIERRDSLKNGAIIGASVLGGLCAFICGQGLENGSDLAGAVAINAMFGALIGTGIDALHKGRTPIYPPARPDGRGHALRPSLGVRVRF